MNSNFLIIFIFLFNIDYFATALCPNGCTCANTIVICTCHPPSDLDLGITLDSFRQIDFVSKIFIHKCQNLTIPSDAFAGLSIGEELSISSIRYLHLHPYAFRDLIKYPEKFTIADSTIPILPSNAFFGFHRVRHMWFRNVTMSRIADGSFRHVSDIEYVYIRESNVGRIESNAFSNMTNISHFFIRGQTKIDRIESSAFRYSTFKKIVVEDVRIRSLNAFSFNGPLRYDSMLFENVIIENIDYNNPNYLKIDKISSARKLDFLRCRFERRFSLTTICSNILEVKFEDCQFDRLAPLPSNYLINLKNMTRLQFRRSTINQLEGRAFYGMNNIKSINFQDTLIKSMGEKSFATSSGIEEMIFSNCDLDKFGSSAFEQASIKRFEINGCRIDILEPKIFLYSKIDYLRFAYSQIKFLETNAFEQLRADYFGLDHVRFGHVRDYAFANIKINNFNFSNCDFVHSQIKETWLSGVSFRTFSFQANKFLCSCQSKFVWQLAQLKKIDQSMTPRYLTMKNNFCLDESSNYTSNLEEYFPTFCRNIDLEENPETISGSIRCTKNLFFVVCSCIGNHYSQNILIDEQIIKKISILKNATTFSISQCRRLRMAKNAISQLSLSHLIINNNDFVELETDFWFQKSRPPILLIQISHVTHLKFDRNSFSFTQSSTIQSGHFEIPTEIDFHNCTIGKLTTNIFENARLGRLQFFKCRIGNFEPFFARKARIDEFLINNCELGRLSRWALNDSRIEKFYFEKSGILELQTHFAPESMTKKTFICFASNRLACQCDITGVDILLNSNGCDGSTNLCFDNLGASLDKKINDDLLSVYGHGHEKGGANRCFDNTVAVVGGGMYDLPQRDMAELVHLSSSSLVDDQFVFHVIIALIILFVF